MIRSVLVTDCVWKFPCRVHVVVDVHVSVKGKNMGRNTESTVQPPVKSGKSRGDTAAANPSQPKQVEKLYRRVRIPTAKENKKNRWQVVQNGRHHLHSACS